MPHKAQAGIIGLGKYRVLRFEDELGEKNLILAFVDLRRIRSSQGSKTFDRDLLSHKKPAHCTISCIILF